MSITHETISKFQYDKSLVDLMIDLAGQEVRPFVSLQLKNGIELQGELINASKQQVLLAAQKRSDSSTDPYFVAPEAIEAVRIYNSEFFLKIFTEGRAQKPSQFPIPTPIVIKRKL